MSKLYKKPIGIIILPATMGENSSKVDTPLLSLHESGVRKQGRVTSSSLTPRIIDQQRLKSTPLTSNLFLKLLVLNSSFVLFILLFYH